MTMRGFSLRQNAALWLAFGAVSARSPFEGGPKQSILGGNDADSRSEATQRMVAIATQGMCSGAESWLELLLQLHHYHNVNFFYLAYDEDPATCLSNLPISGKVHLIYGPNSTWTTGRNMLAKAIYKTEEESGYFHKYWVLLDSDMKRLECHYCRHRPGSMMPSCCFDNFLQFLVGPQQFAMVAINIWEQSEPAHAQFHRHDCPDAALNAFHRAALPVILPYNSRLDNSSWWSSQEVVFHLGHACLKGGIVTLGGFSVPAEHMEHDDYPRGLDHGAVAATLEMDYEFLIPWPIETSGVALEQSYCPESYEKRWEAISTNLNETAVWQKTASYKACLEYLGDRFDYLMRS